MRLVAPALATTTIAIAINGDEVQLLTVAQVARRLLDHGSDALAIMRTRPMKEQQAFAGARPEPTPLPHT
jgi:hypothetical protein